MITHESSLDQFTNQLSYVLETYQAHGLKADQFQHIILGGLGGSGIGAAIARNWFYRSFPVPIETANDYQLPAYVNQNSLVVLNSYSGNTEETLSMCEQAKSKGASILVLASGGELLRIAKENGWKHYILEEGFQPRMTIGYGLGFMLMILGELVQQDIRAELESVIQGFEENQALQKASSDRIYQFFKSNLSEKFVILADSAFAPVGLRFCQQLNENAKLEAFLHLIPESNHNVIESYVDHMESNYIFLFSGQNDRVAARFDFVMSHLELSNNKVLPLFVPEYSIYTIFDMIYRLDWVSVLIANELHAPLMEVPVITGLKEYLSALEIVDEEE